MGDSGCAKFVVVAINIIFMLFGVAVLALGLVFKFAWEDVRAAFVDNSDAVDLNLAQAGDTVAYGAIILGSFILVVSLLGCIGACCEVKCLLGLYAIIVLLLLIGEVIVVILAVTNVDHTSDQMTKGLKDSLKNYFEDSLNDRSRAFSALFSTLGCCGISNGTTDFTTDNGTVPFYPSAARDIAKYPVTVPITCCKGVEYEKPLTAADFDKNSDCLTNANSANRYKQGCLTSVQDEIEKNKSILIGVGVTIFVIEILMVISAFYMCCRSDHYGTWK